MTPWATDVIELTTKVAGSAVILALLGSLVKRWVDRVDNTLSKIGDVLQSHLIQEEGFRGELEGIKLILSDLRDLRLEQAEIRAEQIRVREELRSAQIRRHNARENDKRDFHD